MLDGNKVVKKKSRFQKNATNPSWKKITGLEERVREKK
jgi:hypothetical protein